jgi:hypothetical protein
VTAKKLGFLVMTLAVAAASVLASPPARSAQAATPSGFSHSSAPAQLAGALAAANAPVAPAASTVTTTNRYQASASGVVTPGRSIESASGTSSAASPKISKGARLRPGTAGAARANPQAPAAASAAVAAGSSLLHSFNGVSSLDSELTNYRQRFEPPDQGLCVGNGFVLEPVNSAYRIYHTNGSTIEGPFNVNDLFNEGGQEFTSDPRCHYDSRTNTWFAIVLFLKLDGSASHLDVAVNPSGDPTTLWTEYQFDTTHPGGRGCPCFGDQPRIGIDQSNLYVSSDEFSILGPEFNGAEIQVFSKSDLIAGNPAHFALFRNLSIGGVKALSVQPAISTGFPAAEYFMNSLDPNNTFDNRIGVWAFTGRQLAQAGNVPTLSSTIITSEPYGFPVAATQRGSFSPINPDDDRMQQVQFIGGNIWGELDTAVTIAGDSVERDGGAWFTVHPTLSGDVIGTPVIKQQGYVEQAGAYVLYPALQADAAGRSAMVFTLTGDRIFPSAAYAVLGTGQSQFTAPAIAANGSGPYDPNAGRWGDYSWAVLNSASDDFWLATEYMPPVASQTTTRERNWGTRVLDVSVS